MRCKQSKTSQPYSTISDSIMSTPGLQPDGPRLFTMDVLIAPSSIDLA